jgi:hypothetical protein
LQKYPFKLKLKKKIKFLLFFLFKEIECPIPINIKNGVLTANDYHYSSVIQYKCDIGFQIRDGDYIRECQRNGEWSGKEPKCQSK